MKKFIVKTFFFSLIFLVSSFIIQQIIYFSVKQINVGDFGVLNKIVQGKINSDIIIIGSSRGFVDFDPNVISKVTGLEAYNISQNGTRFGVQVPLLKTYLNNNEIPKILIQEIGFYSLALESGINDEFKYLPYLHEDSLYSGLLNINKTLWLQKYLPPATFHYFDTDFQRRIFRDLVLSYSKGSDYLEKGFHPNNIPWNIDEEKFLKKNKDGLYNRITEIAIEYLQEIISICRRNNIKLVIVNTPEYYKIAPLQNKQDEITKIYKDIASKEGIYYLDYTKSEMTKERSYFYNFTHLNPNGAAEFSRNLASDLVKIGIVNDQL